MRADDGSGIARQVHAVVGEGTPGRDIHHPTHAVRRPKSQQPAQGTQECILIWNSITEMVVVYGQKPPEENPRPVFEGPIINYLQ